MENDIVPSEDYLRLASALEDARGDAGRADVRMAGEKPREWTVVLGGHVTDTGAIQLGYGLTVEQDATVAEHPYETVVWRGGHTMPDGSRTERFTIGGVATTITWTPRRRPGRMSG